MLIQHEKSTQGSMHTMWSTVYTGCPVSKANANKSMLPICLENHSHHSLMLLQQKHIYIYIIIYKQVLSSNHIWKRNFPAFVDDFPTEISIYRGTSHPTMFDSLEGMTTTSAPRLLGTEDPTSTVTKGRSPAAGMVWRGQRASEFWHFW